MRLLPLALLLVLTVVVVLASTTLGFRGTGVILIGPIPIVIDVSDPGSAPLLLIPLIIMIAFILATLHRRQPNASALTPQVVEVVFSEPS